MTYNQIINDFKYIATKHKFIRSFGFGNIDEINPEKFIYPCFWVAPALSSFSKNSLNLRFNLLCFDILQPGGENKEDVLSDTLSYMTSIRNYLQSNPCNDYQLNETGQLENFVERFNDNVGGWRLEVELELPSWADLCDQVIESPCVEPNSVIDTTSNPNLPCSYFGCLTSNTIYVNSFSAITIYSGNTLLETIIYNIVSANTQGTNIGTGTGEVFKNKLNNTLRFRTLSAGTNIYSITTEAATVTINAATQADQFWEYGISGQQSIQRKNSLHYNTSPYSLVAGKQNALINAPSSAILGGFYNLVNGNGYVTSGYNLIGGGRVNRINTTAGYDTKYSTILNGATNNCNGHHSLIGGGIGNQTSSNYTLIVNGTSNRTNAQFATVLNGGGNINTNDYSVTLNGKDNESEGKFSIIGNGFLNHINTYTITDTCNYCLIGNGLSNTIETGHALTSSNFSTILNANHCQIVDSKYSLISSGRYNTISTGNYGSVISGLRNRVYGNHSNILNGKFNINSGVYSSIISSTYSTINSGLTNVSIIGLNYYTATTANRSYIGQDVLIPSLSGSTTQMVVASSAGLLSVQTIPTGSGSTSGSSITYKASAVTKSMFTGSPYRATVTFPSAFDGANYSIQITGMDERAWTYESKAAGGFVINSNSNFALTGATTDWVAIYYN